MHLEHTDRHTLICLHNVACRTLGSPALHLLNSLQSPQETRTWQMQTRSLHLQQTFRLMPLLLLGQMQTQLWKQSLQLLQMCPWPVQTVLQLQWMQTRSRALAWMSSYCRQLKLQALIWLSWRPCLRSYAQRPVLTSYVAAPAHTNFSFLHAE